MSNLGNKNLATTVGMEGGGAFCHNSSYDNNLGIVISHKSVLVQKEMFCAQVHNHRPLHNSDTGSLPNASQSITRRLPHIYPRVSDAVSQYPNPLKNITLSHYNRWAIDSPSPRLYPFSLEASE